MTPAKHDTRRPASYACGVRIGRGWRFAGIVALGPVVPWAAACGGSHAPATATADASLEASADAVASVPDGATACSGDGGTTVVDPATAPQLTVSGDEGSVHGVFDPSLVWPGDGGGYLSYTSLAAAALFTRIARSDDGVSFRYVADVNADADLAVATTDTTVCGASTCNGLLVHETSSLVDDPGDPDPSRRFKVFDYSYVIVPGANPPAQHTWAYVGLYAAASPEGPWSAGTKAIGWTSSAASVSSEGAATLLSSLSGLQDCLALTEPAAIVDGASGALYLALGCAGTASPRVVLLRSTDHAATFTAVGELLSAADGTAVGGTSPGAMPTDLFEDQGATYLVVSTLGTTPTVANAPEGYTSCTTVVVEDLATAKVHRDAAGAPEIVRRLVAPGGAFAGACAFKPGLAAGYLVPEVVAAGAVPDVVLASGIRCP